LLSQGKDPLEALTFANKAAALKVTKLGTANAIPNLAEVLEFNAR
jgi:sugar/nucleoside kinase (ribokinase family)